MPFKNQHAARITDPDQYDEFRRKNIAPGIDIILGIKGEKTETQAYRFDAEKFTFEEVKKWLKDHNIKTIMIEESISDKEHAEIKALSVKLDLVNIQSFSQKEIIELIPSETMREITRKDPHPFFQMFSLCHEGTSNPKILDHETKPITWTKRAIQSIKNIVTKGIKFFKGHNEDSSTDNREVLGEVVHSLEREIDGKLHHVVISYHDPKVRDKIKDFDVISQEASWNLIDAAGKLIADSIDKLTGIALADSREEKPAFAGARRLGMIQCFNESDKNQEMIKMTFEDVKKAVKDLNIFPRQIFSAEDLKNDFSVRDMIKSVEDKLTEEKNARIELEKVNKNLSRSSQLLTAKDRITNFLKELKLTEKQSAFITDSFTDKIDDLTDEGLKKFIGDKIETFKAVAKYVNPAEESLPDIKKVESESDKDFSKAKNNPLLEDDLN
jgi:hypothetical protein